MSVTVQGLRRKFAATGVPAVEDVSFAAPAGAITVLLGPSGSGKTTVLRMIAGLEEPDAGTVFIGEQDCTWTPVRKRGVGLVFQGYALFEHLDVRGNIAFGLRVQGVGRREADARVEELLSLVQLEGMAERFPSQLSGGQRQRVAFARALAPRPKVLLLDEPFGALDARVRIELRSWLRALNERTHLTTVLVTHDQDEALEVSEQVVVLNGGRVEQIGTPHDVYDHPASPFVAAFIGTSNVLRGRVEDGRAAVGPLSITAPGGAPNGAGVQAFVRPHEVKIAKAVDGAGHMSLAVIEGLTRVGGVVRVSLRLPSSEAMSVQLPRAELDALGVSEGDRVIVDIGNAKVFVGDYAI
jgi:sulfate/thiosulfate transport system ATP-binding protein